MKQKISCRCYRMIRWLVKLFYPRTEAVGAENLPKGSCLVVGNHAQMNGPIVCELYFPTDRFTWCAGQMMHLKEVPGYAYQDFWSQKPRWSRWFYKLLSYVIAPISVCVFNQAKTIPVYKDARIITTFKQTAKRLKEGSTVVIFPEQDVPYNPILNDFQDKFIDIARLYFKQTGKALPYVPMYIAPKLKKLYLGEPVYFQPDMPMEEERQRIKTALQERITEIAVSLPRHKVVPYRNISSKLYPYNRPEKEAASSEKAGS